MSTPQAILEVADEYVREFLALPASKKYIAAVKAEAYKQGGIDELKLAMRRGGYYITDYMGRRIKELEHESD